jgi:excisionase family DNA binding protein
MSTKPQIQDSGPLELWTVEETAAFLRVPVATLHKWRHLGKGPRGHRVGKYVRFDAAEVRRWVLSC